MDINYIGKVVLSKSGRDEGKYFIIIGIINDDYVYISDGDLRPVEKPKRKKVKHLYVTTSEAVEIKELILTGDKISNKVIKNFLQSMNSNEEV